MGWPGSNTGLRNMQPTEMASMAEGPSSGLPRPLSMYVCMYVCMNECMYVCVHVFVMSVNFKYVCMCINACMYE